MKKYLLIGVFLLIFFGLYGQQVNELSLNQGQTIEFNVSSELVAPIVVQPSTSGNVVNLISQTGSVYTYEYVPSSDFIGNDYFELKVTLSIFPPDQVIHQFFVTVNGDGVVAHDDFIHLYSQDAVVLDPLSNDYGEIADIKISQVQHGSAVVNDDMTITYTPNGNGLDFIKYSIKDSSGIANSSMIYISFDVDVPESLDDLEYYMSSGSQQYLFLPNASYSLVDTPVLGTVEQVSENVYHYLSNESASGDETLTFESDSLPAQNVSIHIYERPVDDGFVKDDIVYGAKNTMVTFNVFDNDLNNGVISDYSEELYYIGDGVFAYTPDPGFSGILEFFYTVDDGINEEETGNIEVVINNFVPNTDQYSLKVPKNHVRVIEYNVPIATESFEIDAYPLHGNVEVFLEDELVDLECDTAVSALMVVYTPDDGYVGVDQFTIRYCASGNNACDEVNITMDVAESDVDACICTVDCVWPGDADGDGKVNVVDALTIGRYLGQGGSDRETSMFEGIFNGSSGSDWGASESNGKDIKHADANGDGYVTIEDFQEVVDHYGAVHSLSSDDDLGVKFLPFYLSTPNPNVPPGGEFLLNVHLGTATFPAIDIQGVSFAININPTFVDSASAQVKFIENGYFVKQAPYVELFHQPKDGVFHFAGIKTDNVGSTGFGICAQASFIVEEVAEGFKDVRKNRSTGSGDMTMTIVVDHIIIEDTRGMRYSLPPATLDVVIDMPDALSNEDMALEVFPNPASDKVTIVSKNGIGYKSVELYTLSGQKVYSSSFDDQTTEAAISLSSLPRGLYMVKAMMSDGTKLVSKLSVN